MATIKDVAQLANVSIATVSNYLNHTKPVSKAASIRIKSAIDVLHYTQNIQARSLKTNTYSDIAVILPDFNDSFYVQLFQGIEQTFQNSPFFLNVAFSNDVPEMERNIIQKLLKKQISGLIILPCQPDCWKFYYDYFTRQEKPMVVIDRHIQNLEANFITFDYQTAVQGLTAQYLRQGYQNICLISGSPAFSCEKECQLGFRKAHADAEVTLLEENIIQAELSKEDAFRVVVRLLSKRTPDMIVTTQESVATGAVEALRFLGYSHIPVITLGEEHWNQYTHSFANDSLARPAIKMGHAAATVLMNQLHSPVIETEQIVFPAAAALFSTIAQPDTPSFRPDPHFIRILMVDSPFVQTFRRLVVNFEKTQQIRTEIEILPHPKMYKSILSDDEGRYDVILYDVPWLAQLASTGILTDITELITSIDQSVFLENSLFYFSSFRNRYYGLPFLCMPQIFYYRKDLFNDPGIRTAYEKFCGITLRPPVTFKEYHTIANFFTHQTDAIAYGISIPAAYNECLAPEIHMRLQAYGIDLFHSDGSVAFQPAQALKAYINLIRSVHCAKPDYFTATDSSAVEDFLHGDTAMLIAFSGFLEDMADLRKNSMIGSIGYSMIPGRTPLLGGWSLGIHQKSGHKEDAARFLQWVSTQQVTDYLTLLGNQCSLSKSYENDELIKLYPWLPLYRQAYTFSRLPRMPQMRNGAVVPSSKVDDVLCKWAYRMIREETEVQEAVAATQAELTALTEIYSKGTTAF